MKKNIFVCNKCFRATICSENEKVSEEHNCADGNTGKYVYIPRDVMNKIPEALELAVNADVNCTLTPLECLSVLNIHRQLQSLLEEYFPIEMEEFLEEEEE